jgi:hypothetical protein
MMSKLQSHEEFEKELVDHLQEQAAKEGRSVDQLRNEVAYERFLARMDPEHMTIKGGYAVKSQVPMSPYTRDIDMILVEEQLPTDKSKLPRAIRDVINFRLEQTQIEDHFRFDTGEALGFIDLEPNEAAARMSVRAYIGDSQERFAMFPLDVATTDGYVLPPIIVTGPNHLSWAQIESAQISVAPREYLFADKLLIYVESLNENRIGDMAHMALLAEQGLDLEKVAAAINQLAEQRGLQAQILEPLPEPPREWSATFARIMSGQKELPLNEAFERIKSLHLQMLERKLIT